MLDQVACFHFLYFGLELGQDILPLETCMYYTGIYIPRLPAEINKLIGQYVYDAPGNRFLSHDGITLLRQLDVKQPLLFVRILYKLLHAFNYSEKVEIPLEILNQEIEYWKHCLNCKCFAVPCSRNKLNSALYDIPTVVAYVLRHVMLVNPFQLLDKFEENKLVMMAAVGKCGCDLDFASAALRDDEELVKVAVKQQGCQLRNASKRLQDVHQIVLTAVKNQPSSIAYASKRLRDDKELLTLAIGWIGEASDQGDIQFAHLCVREIELDEISSNREGGFYLKHASKRLQDDEELVSLAVLQDGCYLEFASPRLRDNKDMVCKAMRNGCGFSHASARLQADPEIRRLLNSQFSI